jgi:WD40 repeat protein
VARLPKADIFQIAWSLDRDRMAVIGWEKPVEVRDPISLGLLETIGDGKKIIHFAFSPDADIVAYSENDRSGTAKILHRASGKVVVLDAGSIQPRIVFNPDGSLLATGGSAMVRLWSVGDGHLVREFDVGADGGLRPQFSPDGRLLAVGNRNSSTVLFETSTGRQLSVLGGRSTQEIQFHPGGQTLAETRVDGSIALYRIPDGTKIAERQTNAKELYSVDWSPDGTLLATAGREGKITLWDPRDLTVIRELDAPAWVIQVRFSPDGRNLHYAGGTTSLNSDGHLGVFGVEGSLYSLLHRPRR